MTYPGDTTAATGPVADGPVAGDGAGHDAVDGAVDEAVMGLLAEHVPLTLLVDLVDAPTSAEVLVEEGLPGEEWWDRPEPS
ncbi:hypothetical protein [Aquipuribacter sp. SD81]|uniref:hypothetical protein n=1 Tax=Aquipuribacter sp. SD81 TaxID=3127703 RepID=UPI0030187DD8